MTKRLLLLTAYCLLLTIAAACQPQPAQTAAMPAFTATPTVVVAATVMPTLVAPPVVNYAAPVVSHEQPSFKPLGEPGSKATAQPTAVPATATPGPTFTPPPSEPATDHFWFFRPIAEGGWCGRTRFIRMAVREGERCGRIMVSSLMYPAEPRC